ncbi:MAG: PAS domain-containing protein, partial [Betaproteobacteria bacterium]|nr:PAS domain-containing protein [Betaproteobacteria bacterium]
IWTPDYGLHAVTKMFTAVVSVATAVGLWPLLPKILKIPSVKQLQDAISALEIEVAKRKTAEEHLADTEQSLSATLDLIGAGFITTDADGRILRMNPVAERITGWQLTQAAQRRLADVFRVATGSDTDGRLFESIHALAGDHATEHSLCLRGPNHGVTDLRAEPQRGRRTARPDHADPRRDPTQNRRKRSRPAG